MTTPAPPLQPALGSERPSTRGAEPAPVVREPVLGATAGWLLLLGGLSAGLYFTVATRPYLLTDHLAEPGLHIGTAAGYSIDQAIRFAGGFLLLFALYVVGYRLLARAPLRGPGALALVLGPAAVFHLLLAAIYPIVAGDMFDYVLYGRMWAAGLNPLVATPNDFRPDPYVAYSPWPGEPSVYGPLWAFISVVPTLLARGNLLVGLLLFKAIAVAASLGTAYLLWRILREVAPERAALGAFLFAWNPLVVWEAAGNGHNDVVMVCLAVAGVLALVRRQTALALLLLAASALVKFVTVLLVPFFIAYAWRAGPDRRATWRQIALGLGLSLGLAVLAYLPFWRGPSTLVFLTRRDWFTASFATLLRQFIFDRWHWPLEEAGRLAGRLVAVPVGLFYLGQLALNWRDAARPVSPASGVERLARDSYLIYFVYLVIACTWFQAWYLLWLIWAAALLRDERWRDLTTLFSYGAIASYLWYWIWGLSKQFMDFNTIMAIMVAIIFPLPLAYLGLAFTGGGSSPPTSRPEPEDGLNGAQPLDG